MWLRSRRWRAQGTAELLCDVPRLGATAPGRRAWVLGLMSPHCSALVLAARHDLVAQRAAGHRASLTTSDAVMLLLRLTTVTVVFKQHKLSFNDVYFCFVDEIIRGLGGRVDDGLPLSGILKWEA